MSTVSSKGQVTIPLAVRKRMGLKTGDRVTFVRENGETVLRVNRPLAANPFERFAGALSGGMPEGTAKAWVGSLRDEEPDPQ